MQINVTCCGWVEFLDGWSRIGEVEWINWRGVVYIFLLDIYFLYGELIFSSLQIAYCAELSCQLGLGLSQPEGGSHHKEDDIPVNVMRSRWTLRWRVSSFLWMGIGVEEHSLSWGFTYAGFHIACVLDVEHLGLSGLDVFERYFRLIACSLCYYFVFLLPIVYPNNEGHVIQISCEVLKLFSCWQWNQSSFKLCMQYCKSTCLGVFCQCLLAWCRVHALNLILSYLNYTLFTDDKC